MKFYINRRNKLIHKTHLKQIYLWDCEWVLKELLPKDIKFEFFRIPTLISCTKCNK